jgi:hypothetical protein
MSGKDFMKLKINKKWFAGALLLLAAVGYQNCSGSFQSAKLSSESAGSLGVGPQPTPPGPTPSSTPAAIVAGNGANFLGSGSMSVPTAYAVVARIQNGFQGNVSSTSGNFAKAVALLRTNLPQVADPSKASGFDQVQLLVYAACSDLTTGTSPMMMSKYQVDPTKPIATTQSAIVAAGVKMLDQYVAGLASQGPTSSQVTAALNNVVQTVAADTSSTTTIAFMSVCMAANTAGTTMMGF